MFSMRAVKNLLVLYTGGTIGMLETPEGLAPAGGFDARMREHFAQMADAPQLQWTLQEMNPLLDSANMQQQNWLAMRDAIVEAVDVAGHDGVLVLHGTDTLAYSAAALSFLLLGLPVPVLLTGSMLPAGVPGSDAWDNLCGALRQCEQGLEEGVQLYFHGQLLHGCRASKLRSEAFDAFAALPRHRDGERATALPAELGYKHPRQPVNLALMPVFPGLQAGHLRALLDSGVQGLLLECYGSGTGPSDDQALLDALQAARQRGVMLVAISQCPEGSVVFDTYAAGNRLRGAGLVSGGGMTREAALGKMFALLGAGLDAAAAEQWFALDLCGERGCSAKSPEQSE
ncbi:asparaginase [Pseudomonas sp. 17391]|jgi:L-asparaginase|uniref:Asparaginase n=2 Tax=Pseudomonas TaxID=286 RepID=A0ABY7RB46_9PSED|nr:MULTISPECIES: asparaginase [Pseudomonas]MCH7298559.1 asparaginase [Pseudomonas capeferrum]MDD2065604.1 asparaginase [Pseudomonas sp. 25571]MDD2131955.1 asparaginase [Pseudomonas sp. 17391]UDU81871.1 asparaginase [Pseudomonas sp. HN2-3]WCI00821.1 asparaginase [Pseudomonas capeferrum]